MNPALSLVAAVAVVRFVQRKKTMALSDTTPTKMGAPLPPEMARFCVVPALNGKDSRPASTAGPGAQTVPLS